MRLEIQEDQPYTFEWSFYDKNIKQIPVSGTITVTKPSGGNLVSETSVSIETDGTIKYTISADDVSTLDKNYRIELKYQIGDEVFRPFYMFDVVKTPLRNEVRDEDLFHYLPQLRDRVKTKVIETTSDGTTNTFISTDLQATNIDYKGGYANIYIDDTTTHEAEITDFDSDLATCTFQPEYPTSITTGLKVNIRASFQRFIDDAYNNFVHRDIRNKVGLAAGYVDSTVLRNLTVFKSLENICFYNVEEEADKWSLRAQKFEQKYKDEFSVFSEAYDTDEDGFIDNSEDQDRPNFWNRGTVR